MEVVAIPQGVRDRLMYAHVEAHSAQERFHELLATTLEAMGKEGTVTSVDLDKGFVTMEVNDAYPDD